MLGTFAEGPFVRTRLSKENEVSGGWETALSDQSDNTEVSVSRTVRSFISKICRRTRSRLTHIRHIFRRRKSRDMTDRLCSDYNRQSLFVN